MNIIQLRRSRLLRLLIIVLLILGLVFFASHNYSSDPLNLPHENGKQVQSNFFLCELL